MAPAVTVCETDAAPQVRGHMYVVTQKSQKRCHRTKTAACAGTAQYKYRNIVMPQWKKKGSVYALKMSVGKASKTIIF